MSGWNVGRFFVGVVAAGVSLVLFSRLFFVGWLSFAEWWALFFCCLLVFFVGFEAVVLSIPVEAGS